MKAPEAMNRSSARAATDQRRFRVLDAMILVAATALGCGALEWLGRETDGEVVWTAVYDGTRELFHQSPGGDWPIGEETLELCLLTAWLTTPLVAMWTLALIPIRLLGPRPRIRRLARQPGMMSTCASGVTIVLVGLFALVEALAVELRGFKGPVRSAEWAPIVPMLLGLAVLVSWTTLLIGRRWRAEPSWVDRLGRATGVFWIVVAFAVTSLSFFRSPMSRCEVRIHAVIPPPAVAAAGKSGHDVSA
jgi:hypothetical protein